MQNQKETAVKTPKIKVQIEQFPAVKPKITKENWASGEESGEGDCL